VSSARPKHPRRFTQIALTTRAPDGNIEGESDMFRELMPILNGRQLLLTVSRVDDATLRVCIVPPEKPSR